MDHTITKVEAALLVPSPTTRTAQETENLRLAAARAHEQETLASMLRAARQVGSAIAALGTAIATWPARRATYQRLAALSDRELADIGLTRGEIANVFDPGFGLGGPANDNGGRRAA